MALSDELAKLAARAKQAETRAAAAQKKARTELETDVSDARASASAQAEKLRETAEAGEGKVSDWWSGVQKAWSDHVDAVRADIGERKEKHDRAEARRAADDAQDDAQYAIDYAYAAVEEAEYAVLNAALARMESDELEETVS
jgi:hypothetical protein